MEPLVIEDVPSSASEERMKQQYLSNTSIPIIEDAENPTEIPAETQEETSIDTQPTQLIREPPYPERLTLQKAVEKPQFNLLGELKNLYVEIPLLQALHDVPVYARTVRDMCTRKLGRKPRDPPTIHVIGKLSELIMGKTLLAKYDDPGNTIVTVQIGSTQIPNILVDLGVAINIMTI